jgi:hypothetical protein
MAKLFAVTRTIGPSVGQGESIAGMSLLIIDLLLVLGAHL